MANGSYVESRLMRVDTPINAGNSGGGLFNSNGELIGIVNAKLVDEEIENIGYAIPSNIAKNVADSIIENSVNGDARPKRAIMGITPEIGKVTSYYDEELERAVIKEEVLISKVHDNSLAKDAGLKVGYKILSITLKGKTYQITRLHQVIDLSWLLQVGDVVKFEIEGKTDKINIIITEDCFEYMD